MIFLRLRALNPCTLDGLSAGENGNAYSGDKPENFRRLVAPTVLRRYGRMKLRNFDHPEGL